MVLHSLHSPGGRRPVQSLGNESSGSTGRARSNESTLARSSAGQTSAWLGDHRMVNCLSPSTLGAPEGLSHVPNADTIG
jgi:hypothetical protein